MLNLKYFIFLTTISFGVFTNVTGQNTYNSKILFYNGATAANFISYDLPTAENVVDHPTFDRSKRIEIFTHGWRQTPTDVRILIEAYISNGNYNLLLLDWSEAASSPNMIEVKSKVPEIGVALGSFLNKIFAKGVKIENVHLIGHSFGACISSAAGVYVQRTKPNILPRITGLDPANLYMPNLQKTDATFVDIINTDPGVAGTPFSLGTVNFFPNMYSKLQPGCSPFPLTISNLACSHNRAIFLYAETVKDNNNHNFLSTKVNDLFAPKIQMGLNCPSTATGIYRVPTNSQSRYSQT